MNTNARVLSYILLVIDDNKRFVLQKYLRTFSLLYLTTYVQIIVFGISKSKTNAR